MTSKYLERLSIEDAIMENEMPQFQLFQEGNNWYFGGWHITTTLQRNYELILVLPSCYPDQMPMVYITSPLTLSKYGGGTINSAQNSHGFHTLGTGPNGCVQICHTKPQNWDASQTCVGVFTKILLWIEAYNVHLLTGRYICDILDEWRKRQ